MRKFFGLAAILLTAAPAFAADKDIVDTAVAAGQFETLVAAAKAAGLVEALKGEGPLTVLAPTDEAFAKLPKGTVEELLKPENKEKLAGLLKYHVIKGNVKAADVIKMNGQSAATLCPEGNKLAIKVAGGKVMFSGANSATVIKADIACSNGTIHVIDTVLMPPTK